MQTVRESDEKFFCHRLCLFFGTTSVKNRTEDNVVSSVVTFHDPNLRVPTKIASF
jgi:hypothetical protein